MNIAQAFQETVVQGNHQGMIDLLKNMNNPASYLSMNEVGSSGMFPMVTPC
ncbi:hypothetical protein P9222_25440 [Paenibacillus amylolyticus]|nr:hypothetical protein [Paenibacillus amylolyticus]WFR61700.1 hypothetical protein P9222_25440 [Paenibacillus amylolyticus]